MGRTSCPSILSVFRLCSTCAYADHRHATTTVISSFVQGLCVENTAFLLPSADLGCLLLTLALVIPEEEKMWYRYSCLPSKNLWWASIAEDTTYLNHRTQENQAGTHLDVLSPLANFHKAGQYCPEEKNNHQSYPAVNSMSYSKTNLARQSHRHNSGMSVICHWQDLRPAPQAETPTWHLCWGQEFLAMGDGEMV